TASPFVDLDLVDQRPDLVFDRLQADHAVELGEQLLDQLRILLVVTGGHTRHGTTSATRAALADLDSGPIGARHTRRRGVLHIGGLHQAVAATADHDPHTLGVVHPALHHRGRALVGHRDAGIARLRNLASFDASAGRLVHVDPAESTPGDNSVADRRHRSSAQENAVVGDVLHLALVHFGVAVFDHQSVTATGEG